IADLVVVRTDSKHLAVGGTVVAHCADVLTIQHRRQGAYKLCLASDCEVVLVSEVIGLSGLCAAFNSGNAPGKHKHNVLSECGQLLLLAAAKTFSQAHQEEQRADAPGDSEHGEEGAQIVRPEGRERLADNGAQHAHKGMTENHAPTPPGRSVGAPGERSGEGSQSRPTI